MTKIVKLGRGGFTGYVSLFFRLFMFVWNLYFKRYSFLMTHDFHNLSSHNLYWLKIFFLYLSIWYLSYIRGEIWFLYNNWLSKWDIWEVPSFLGICLSAQRIYTYILPTADDYCHTVMFNAYLTRSGQSLHFWSYPHGHFSASGMAFTWMYI